MRFSRQEYWVGCHSLLRGIFLTHGMNLGVLHCRWIPYCLSHQGNPQLLSRWKANQQKQSPFVSTFYFVVLLIKIMGSLWKSIKWRKMEEYKIPQLLGTLLTSISLYLLFLYIVGSYSICHLVSCFPPSKNSRSNNFNYRHNILY